MHKEITKALINWYKRFPLRFEDPEQVIEDSYDPPKYELDAIASLYEATSSTRPHESPSPPD